MRLRCLPLYADKDFTLGFALRWDLLYAVIQIADVLKDLLDQNQEVVPYSCLAEFVGSCTPEELLSWRNNGRTVLLGRPLTTDSPAH